MRILSWNVNFRSEACLEGIHGLEADIVLLQEVKHEAAGGFLASLARSGCNHSAYSGSPSDEHKRYGNVIASRWSVSAMARGWAPAMRWPQLALRSVVRTPRGDIEIFNVHIPNGRGNGWDKVYSLEALADALDGADHGARVLGGDFNEPQTILPNGQLVTWGQRLDADGSTRLGRRSSGGAPPGWFTDKEGRSHDLQRWDSAVRRIFEGSAHGLRHVRAIADSDPQGLPVTHIVQGKPRFFDHLFVSSHLRADRYEYVDSVRENLQYSDHSAVYVDVEFA